MPQRPLKKIIGRVEKISFPSWDIQNLDAKVDSGAYTSSLHCHHIETVSENDSEFVLFSLFDPAHPSYRTTKYRSELADIRKVKSSNGEVETRYVIRETAIFCGRKRNIELTLTDRSNMKFDLLLGRRFLKNYLVDVSKKYLNS
ncbi:MAG: hypothetical protein GVY08_12450 [Bacteroidetes bacterium]|jgi:hypothetical protein|nr:hypothetical protein [Bacteroidota bacterium]